LPDLAKETRVVSASLRKMESQFVTISVLAFDSTHTFHRSLRRPSTDRPTKPDDPAPESRMFGALLERILDSMKALISSSLLFSISKFLIQTLG